MHSTIPCMVISNPGALCARCGGAMGAEVLSGSSALLSFRPVACQLQLAQRVATSLEIAAEIGRIQQETPQAGPLTQWSLTVGCGVMQLLEASKRPEDFSIMLTDMLFRTAGRTNLLRVPSTYHLKPDAAETLRARILRATACFHTVRDLFVSCASVPAMLGPVHVRRAGLWGTLLADTFPSDNARSIGVICPHACPSKKAN